MTSGGLGWGVASVTRAVPVCDAAGLSGLSASGCNLVRLGLSLGATVASCDGTSGSFYLEAALKIILLKKYVICPDLVKFDYKGNRCACLI